MIIVEAILYLLFLYILTIVCCYAYLVVKSYEMVGVWNFEIKDGYIGIFEYPKWMFFWLEKIINKVKKVNSK